MGGNRDFRRFCAGLKTLGLVFVRRERLFGAKRRIVSFSREFLERLEL